MTALATWLLLPVLAFGQKAYLLNVQKGELPNDASAQVALTTDNPEQPDGITLKVTYGKGAFGQYNPRLKDWSSFQTMRFYVFNPAQQPVSLYLALRDKDTVDYNTRSDIPFTVQPGRNNISLPIRGAVRINGAAFDLSSIRQWFISRSAEGPDQDLYFGDIVLEGAPTTAPGPAAPSALPAPAPPSAPAAHGTIVLEGRVRIEIDTVTLQNLVAAAQAGAPSAPQPTPAPRAYVLNLAAGQLPSDNSPDVTVALSDQHAAELGGKTLRVQWARKETSFGMGAWGAGAVPFNWTGFDVLRFEAFNPSDRVLGCYMAVRDRKTGYENRADMPFRLSPGLNKIELPIGVIATNAGGTIDKANITQWYICCDQPAEVYFSSLRLENE